MNDAAGVRRFIEGRRLLVVAGHKEPDGDCIASQLAVAALAGRLGTPSLLLSAGPFDRPEIEDFAGRFSASAEGADLGPGAAAVIVDCSTPDRTGSVGPALAGLACLVIDHHSSGEVFGDVRYVDPAAPSTSALVLAIHESLGVPVDRDTARLLLFGLCTDTGFFRHLGTDSAETFRAVARLTERGTSTAEAFMMVYGRRSLASRKLLARMLERTLSLANDALLVSWQTLADREAVGAAPRGEEDLYRLLQTVKGNRAVVFLKEEEAGRWSVGLRSNPGIDVGVVALGFGGGGHRQAAGCDIAGTLESVRAAVVAALLPLL
ncbi:MAG: bifunctional oligoribonuclease/PAP phosphatase NrnA [Spirochaetes bacterium]|nr:bifunctional oligoribonuclease/PAP phosphatase NrnA [Spirochaetota bacterium]